MQARGHGRLARVVLAALGESKLQRVRRTVPPDLPTFTHTPNQGSSVIFIHEACNSPK